jgi:hypothetical protein
MGSAREFFSRALQNPHRFLKGLNVPISSDLRIDANLWYNFSTIRQDIFDF